MSWIFGIIGNSPERYIDRFKAIRQNFLMVHQTPKIYLACGGMPDTCFFENKERENGGWIVCGVGITDRYSIMYKQDWQTIMAAPFALAHRKHLGISGGHYVAISWDGDKIECFNDPLGLRDIYFSKWKDYYIISTDLKWIAKVTDYNVLNLKNLGSVWLLNNQLTHRSLLNNIERLGSGGYITFENNVHTLKRKLYQPKQTDDGHAFKNTLEQYTSLFAGPSHLLSLGLSGGLDSRCLFSMLLKNKRTNWSVHTFGSIDHPDSRIAKRMASHCQIPHTLVDATLPSLNDCVAFLKQTIGRNPVAIPASEIMNLRNYLPLKHSGKMVIDGGFGEITRRQYLNRLLYKGGKALRDQAVAFLYPHLTHFKAQIFNKETLAVLQAGVRDDLLDLFQTMPDVNAMAIGNWLDLLAVRTRLPNFFGFAQVNADNHIISLMPFAQLDMLDAIFQIPVQERKNGKLLKQIIEENSGDLTKFELVKFNTTYPFRFSSLSSYLYCKAKIRLGRAYRSTKTRAFLFHLKEFIQDSMHSESVINYPLYDYPYIKQIVNAFYNGNYRYQHELDWWLAFELFR